MIVALFLEDLLTELGHKVTATIGRVDEAMAMAESDEFDIAILDVHLHGQPIFPFAERLLARGIPFVFATGFGIRGVPDHLRGAPTLQKPFRPDELADTIARLPGGRETKP
ncbi:MAG: response regulator [Alphaproteobacteria bacterium]|nr:response regulator [Alphaproteobacteria bacterium]